MVAVTDKEVSLYNTVVVSLYNTAKGWGRLISGRLPGRGDAVRTSGSLSG